MAQQEGIMANMDSATTFIFGLSRRHIVGILFAIFAGLFVVAPQLIFIAKEGEHYQGLYMMLKPEGEWYYLARMNEFYDEGRIGNSFLYEHKFYAPIPVPSGAEILLAVPGKILNISVPTLNLIYKFLLPAIYFLLVYALIFRLTGAYPWAIAGGLMSIMGTLWFNGIDLAHLFRLDWYWEGFVYNRPVHPPFDNIHFFLYLHALLSVHEGKGFRSLILLGALLAASFFTYFYSYTFFLALNGVFFITWYFLGKKKLAFGLAGISIAALIVGSYPLWQIYSAIQHPDYPQITAYAPEFTHLPEISKNGLLVSFFLAIYLFRTKALRAGGIIRDHAIFFVGLLITTFIVVNQQVLTGTSLHSGHFHWMYNVPIFLVALMFLGKTFFDLLPPEQLLLQKFSRVAPWLLSLLFIVTGLCVQYGSYVNNAPKASEDQRYMSALYWLRDNATRESVVMANETLSSLVSIHTPNNVMWVSGARNFLTPPERYAFTPENLLQSDDFLRDIKQYRVDYILWDEQSDPDWMIDRFGLPLAFSSGGLRLYKLPDAM